MTYPPPPGSPPGGFPQQPYPGMNPYQPTGDQPRAIALAPTRPRRALVCRTLRDAVDPVIDAAVLDAKLIDGSGADLADSLDRNGIPYVVASGYEKAALPERLKAAPFVAKPIATPFLIDTLRSPRL